MSCKQTYCQKKTVLSYQVVSINSTSSESINYNINIIAIYKGLPPNLRRTILEVPRSNKKHVVLIGQQYLFMSSVDSINNPILTLTPKTYNKLLSRLSIVDLVFLNNDPNRYCQLLEETTDNLLQRCIKECTDLCIYCDDEEGCGSHCKKKCRSISWSKLGYSAKLGTFRSLFSKDRI